MRVKFIGMFETFWFVRLHEGVMWTVGLLLQCLKLIHCTLPNYTLPQVLQDFLAKAPITPIDLTATLIYAPPFNSFSEGRRSAVDCFALAATPFPGPGGAGAAGTVFSHTQNYWLTARTHDRVPNQNPDQSVNK